MHTEESRLVAGVQHLKETRLLSRNRVRPRKAADLRSEHFRDIAQHPEGET